MQPLNIFYPLKDSKSLLFNELLMQLLNHSRNFLRCFLILTPYSFPWKFAYQIQYHFPLFFKSFPGHLRKKTLSKGRYQNIVLDCFTIFVTD